MPFFSVIIPTYNRSSALRKTIKSVIEQSLTDYEIIIVDDGSTDDTKNVVDHFSDARVRYQWIPNSGGPATPRNVGIDMAASEWVCFLDSDDIWYPSKLETIYKAISENPGVNALCHDELIHYTGTGVKKLLKYGPVTPNFYQTLLVDGNRCSTSAMTVERKFLEENKLRFNISPDYVSVEDYDLWLKMALYKCRFKFINIPLGEYVIDDGNITGNSGMHMRNSENLLREHVFHIQDFESDKNKIWNKILARKNISKAFLNLRKGHFICFFKLFVHAFCLSPLTIFSYFIVNGKAIKYKFSHY